MKGYPQYKESGIEWIGAIPDEWHLKKIKHVCQIQGRVGFKGYKSSDLVNEGEGVYTIGGKHISNNQLDFSDPTFLSWEKYYESPEIMVKKGHVIVTQRGTLGKVAVVEKDIGDATINPSMILLKEITCDNKFLYYYFQSQFILETINLMNTATAVPMISQSQLSNFDLVYPSLEEQTAIANFLDHKTTQIDAAIEKHRQLIELLQEHRVALINEAVTKGINPNVPMKYSGIEWIGEIPAHWMLTRMLYVSKIVRGASPRPAGSPLYFNGNHTPWITVAEVTKDNHKYLKEVTNYLTEEGRKNSRYIEEGTLLLSNSGATLGVPKISLIGGCINDGSVAFLNLDEKVYQDFLYYYLFSLTGHLREITKVSGQPNLNTDLVKALNLPLPPKEEQHKIVEYVESETERIDKEVDLAHNEIALLEEYRQSLIAEAVTGKIDVRDYPLT